MIERNAWEESLVVSAVIRGEQIRQKDQYLVSSFTTLYAHTNYH